jgi:hypothetical protein
MLESLIVLRTIFSWTSTLIFHPRNKTGRGVLGSGKWIRKKDAMLGFICQ